jgi:hypothetical protein
MTSSSAERLAVQRRAAVCGRPSAATACWTALGDLNLPVPLLDRQYPSILRQTETLEEIAMTCVGDRYSVLSSDDQWAAAHRVKTRLADWPPIDPRAHFYRSGEFGRPANAANRLPAISIVHFEHSDSQDPHWLLATPEVESDVSAFSNNCHSALRAPEEQQHDWQDVFHCLGPSNALPFSGEPAARAVR